MREMSIDDIVGQDINFHRSNEFKKYMQDNTGIKGSNKRFNYDLIRKKAAEKLDEQKQAEWSGQNFFETPETNEDGGGI